MAKRAKKTLTLEQKIRALIDDEENRVIRCRDERYENPETRGTMLKKVLDSIQTAWMVRDLLGTKELDGIITFALAMFPIETICNDNGDVSDAYKEFMEKIPEYTIDELYDVAVNLKGVEP